MLRLHREKPLFLDHTNPPPKSVNGIAKRKKMMTRKEILKRAKAKRLMTSQYAQLLVLNYFYQITSADTSFFPRFCWLRRAKLCITTTALSLSSWRHSVVRFLQWLYCIIFYFHLCLILIQGYA